MRCFALALVSLVCLAAGLETEGFDESEDSAFLIRHRRRAPKFKPLRTYLLSDAIEERILELHNQVRRSVQAANMRKMHWDDSLAEYSSTMSQECDVEASMSKMKHDRFGRMGMSKFMRADMNFNLSMIDVVFNEWLEEKKKFLYQPGFEQCTTGYKDCDAYKQIIWATSFMVGCGASTCNSIKLGKRSYTRTSGITFYCTYGPRGNHFAVLPYIEGRPCSACDDPNDTCQRGLCTNPRRLRTPTAPSAWLEWGPWSTCSRTCGGGGTAKRYRKCNTFVEVDCEGSASQNQILCAPYTPCPPAGRVTTTPRSRTRTTPRSNTRTTSSSGRWTKWGKWASCPTTCGAGIRVRRRTCLPKNTGVCPGTNTQTGPCRNRACTGPARRPTTTPTRKPTKKPTTAASARWRNWGAWSDCSRTCGTGGERTRRRACSVRRRNACRGRQRETQRCNRRQCRSPTTPPSPSPRSRSGWANWQSWSSCSASCGRSGTRRRSRVCNSRTCPGKATIVRQCNRITCRRTTPTPRTQAQTPRRPLAPAVLSKWSPWAACTKPCGTGSRRRTRTCSRPGACTDRLVQVWKCNIRAC